MSRGETLAMIGTLFALAAIASEPAAGLTDEFNEARGLTAHPERGRTLYTACAECHQPDGGGRARAGVPNIAAQHYQVVLEQLVNYRQADRFDERMEVVTSHALKSTQDLVDVAAYVAKLPPVATEDRGPDEFLTQGQAIYARVCSQCHGAAAEGDSQLRFPRLASQHYSYLSWQMKAMLEDERTSVTRAHHRQLLAALTSDEIGGIAGYLARLK